MHVIIFSKDRACQLDALLRSFKESCKEASHCNIFVLYSCSSDEFRQGYKLLQKTNKGVEFIEEKDFWLDLSSILSLSTPSDNLIMFLVDDILFRDNFSLRDQQFEFVKKYNEVVSLSLRLSGQITSCYATGKASPPPKFIKGCFWNWRTAAMNGTDWGYPMSLDGNVYRFDSIKSFLLALPFKNPNTLEASMAQAATTSKAIPNIMVCYPTQSKLLNVPANRVQDTFENRHENTFTAKELNDKFLNGEEIDISSIQSVVNSTVHHPMVFSFSKKG